MKKATIGILGFIGAGIIIFLTNHYGSGMTPDSVAYISTARNLAEGHGFLLYDGSHLVVQPPLYPILLAGIKKILLIDPLISAGYVNALLFGFIIYLSGLLLSKYINSFALIFLGTVSILISYVLIKASLMVLSEPLFIFLVLMFLYFIDIYQSKGNILSLFLLSVLASFACLTRYTGIVILLTGISCILLCGKNKTRDRVRHAFIFILVTVLPVGLWILRNYYLSGTLVGRRAASSYTIFENIGYFYNTVLSWYLPMNSEGIYLVLIIILIAIWILYRTDYRMFTNNEVVNLIYPSLVFVIFYSGLIVISSSTTAYDQISNRLLSPIYIPIIIILFFIIDKILTEAGRYSHQKIKTILLVAGIVLLMRYPLMNTIYFIEKYAKLSGWGYSSDSWTESETIKYFSQNELMAKNYTLFSNEPEAVYILTNYKTRRIPAKTFYNSPQHTKNNPSKKNIWKGAENICLIWFNKTNDSFLYSINELQKNINMKEIARLNDGQIYTFQIEDIVPQDSLGENDNSP
ncbi:MAG: hypothetical protein KKA84_15930 [Bacteroidetes bacterium]|nr:hypothetical protein [Bacteroidota bacterium]